MNEATIALTVMTLLILIVFLGFLVWGIRSRQFHDVEEAKYNMFDRDTESDTAGSDKQEGKE